MVIIGSGPNRIGQGVEFDYSCVHASFALLGCRLRDRHGQLQPRDRIDRLRHLRPPVLRAADARRRARGARRRSRQRHHPRRRLPTAVPDAARDSRRASRRPGYADPRHQSRRDRHRRGARAVLAAAELGRAHRPASRHGDRCGRRRRDRGGHRVSGAGAPELRARRPRHGDRLRHPEPARLLRAHGRRGHRRPRYAAARRPFPR